MVSYCELNLYYLKMHFYITLSPTNDSGKRRKKNNSLPIIIELRLGLSLAICQNYDAVIM